MRASLDMANDWVLVEFDSVEAVETFLESARQQNAFMVELNDPIRPFEPLTIQLVVKDGFELPLDGQAVQLFERGTHQEVVFQLEPWSTLKKLEVERKLSQVAGVDEGETTGSSPMLRIKKMDPNQRARLALQAGRTERNILRRDSSAQVLMNLLNNPKVETEDVLQVVKSTHANGGLLQRIAGDRRWNTNMEIRSALVRNPKTPAPVALRLLDTLRTEDLRQFSKMSGPLRENLRRAALKVYLKRGGRR